VKVDLLSFRNLFISDAFGAYTYNSVLDFVLDKPAASYSYRYSATADPLQEANWKARQYGFYAQDEWTVIPTLKLTGGLRVDLPTYPSHPSHNPGIYATFGYRTEQPPKTTAALSPRLGFNWAVDEERNTQVRGGVGIFYGRFPYVWVSNQYSNTGVDFITVTKVPTRFIPDPYGQGGVGAITTAEVNLTDPKFKAPSILRWNVAVDYKLPFDLVATVEGIFSTTRNDVYYKNINLAGVQANGGLTPGGKLVGEGREVWGVWNPGRRGFAYTDVSGRLATGYLPVNAAFAPGVFLVTNTSKGSNSNASIQIQRNVPNV